MFEPDSCGEDVTMPAKFQIFAVVIALLLAGGAPFDALADDGEDSTSVWTRAGLFDTPGTPRDALRQRGVDFDLVWSQFHQGLVGGDGDKSWQHGGKGDIVFNIDLHKFLGLWPGLSVNIHQEILYGDDANAQGDGTFIPVNTALGFPRLGGYDHDLSIVATQRLGDRGSLSLGKFNMLDAAARTPILGGGGIDTFMHLGIAAPISGVTPPYVIGGLASLRTEPAIFSLMVYDPRNAQDADVLRNPFEDGVTFSLSATVPVTIGGLTGFQGFRAVHSTQEGVDLRDIPQLALPPALRDDVGTKQGYYYASYSFQQFLWQSPDDSTKGWGLFGEFAISEGNPNPFLGHFFAGIGGNSVIPGRSDDRWGVAYFTYRLSDKLRRAARRDLGIELEDEQGVEAYYNLAVTPWFRVTANVEVVNPFPGNRDTATFAGLRTQVRF